MHFRAKVAAILALALPSLAIADNTDPGANLCTAYPEQFHFDAEANEIVWPDNTRMPFGSPRPDLSFEDRLATATLYDQLSIPYPREWPLSPPTKDIDPGRMRCDAFLKKMYGGTAAEVERNLARVSWPPAGTGKTVRFTTINRANKSLERVGEAIAKLSPEVRGYVARPNGTFNWRPIAGTDRLSPHSYGIAIDFDMQHLPNQYWRWAKDKEATASNYPAEILKDTALRQIVEIFEQNGFIWGGKWHHYDLMHFEYRPELLNTNDAPKPE